MPLSAHVHTQLCLGSSDHRKFGSWVPNHVQEKPSTIANSTLESHPHEDFVSDDR
jgi:hypothetical protein